MARLITQTLLFIAITTMSLIACKKELESSVLVKPVQKKTERFNRARFPCIDSIRGIWRVYKYNLYRMGDRYPPTEPGSTMNIAFEKDTMHIFGADTLIFKQYAEIEQLTSGQSQPLGYYTKFSYRINTTHDRNPDLLRGYYAWVYGDSLFLFGSYDDGNDYWLVRDCK